MDPVDRPSPEVERARYDTHENDPYDPRYRDFLRRVLDPLLPLLTPGSRGLDFGAGPGAALQAMLEESGHPTRIYDPFYAPDPIVLEDRYDFVTCTETAEHFHDPELEFRRLDGLLRPGGWLAIMTEILDDQTDFASWYYARDPTHVVFYRRTTLEWAADRHGWTVHFPHRNVGLFRKSTEDRRTQSPPCSSEGPEGLTPETEG
jgi:SAM-dependent methyltransferase